MVSSFSHTVSSSFIATFTISLDLELAWGFVDKKISDDLKWQFGQVRYVIDDLLNLFDKYSISATWAAVWALFATNKHLSTFRKQDADWLKQVPDGDYKSEPLWYATDIVERILNCPTYQEIGCHTFSHLSFDNKISKERFDTELSMCQEVASSWGVKFKSMVFPRNQIPYPYLSLLKDYGYTCFRGSHNEFYAHFKKGTVRRIGTIIDEFLAIAPKISYPKKTAQGLWMLPHGMFWPPRTKARRFLSIGRRLAKAKKGLQNAVHCKSHFHLWFHPFNFAHDRINMIKALDNFLELASQLRDKGKLKIFSMGDLADYLNLHLV